jgi:hypothetical protein
MVQACCSELVRRRGLWRNGRLELVEEAYTVVEEAESLRCRMLGCLAVGLGMILWAV